MTEPRIIDLDFAIEAADGTRFYTPPLEAALIQSGAALGELCAEYPRETGGVLAATAWVTATAYFLYQALQPPKARKRARAK
jgi:hypothetical protein